MQEIKTLIDKASKVCGSDKALAERMGIAPQTVSNLRHGRPITPETAAELADIAGESVKAAVYQSMIERAKGTRREGVLKEILGKSLLAGVVRMSLFSYAPKATAVTKTTAEGNSLVNFIYIVECWIRRLFAKLAEQPSFKRRSRAGFDQEHPTRIVITPDPPPKPAAFPSRSRHQSTTGLRLAASPFSTGPLSVKTHTVDNLL